MVFVVYHKCTGLTSNKMVFWFSITNQDCSYKEGMVLVMIKYLGY